MSGRNKRKLLAPQKNRVRAAPVIKKTADELKLLFPPHNDQFVAPIEDDPSTDEWDWLRVEILPADLPNDVAIWRHGKYRRSLVGQILNGVDSNNIPHYFHIPDLIELVLDYIVLPSISQHLGGSWRVSDCTVEPYEEYEYTDTEPVNSQPVSNFGPYTRGSGLYATQDLEPGMIIAPYLGNILPGARGGDYILSHWTFDVDTTGKKLDYSIDGKPVIEALQVASCANEPSPGEVANCSFAIGIIPGVDFSPFYLVVTKPIQAGDQLLVDYGPEYKRTYEIAALAPLDTPLLMKPVVLSFEQTMEVVRLYGLFNYQFAERIFSVFGYVSPNSE